MSAGKICISSNNFLEEGETYVDLVWRCEPKNTLDTYLREMVIPFGVRYIELWYPGWVVKENVEHVKQILSTCGIRGGSIGYYYPMSTPKQFAGDRRKGLLNAMDVAEVLGFSGVVTLPGPADWYNYTPNEQEVERDIENLIKNVRPAIKWAEERNLTIYMEVGHGACGDTVDRQMRWLKELGAERIRLNFHPVAGNKHREFPEAFERLKDYIAYVHIAGFGKSINLGSNNFDGLLRRLKETSFEGFVCLEHFEHTELLREAVEYCKARGCVL